MTPIRSLGLFTAGVVAGSAPALQTGTPGHFDMSPGIELATHQAAPMRLQLGGRSFGGVWDDVLQWGFNCAPDGLALVPGVSKWNAQLESDFWNLGRHWIEFNLDHITPGGDYRRYMYFGIDRDDPDMCATISLGILGSGSFTVKTATDNALMEGEELLDVDTRGDTTISGTLRVNGGGDNYGEGLTVGVPASGMAMALRNERGDDLLAVNATAAGCVTLKAGCDSNAGSLRFCSQQNFKEVEQLTVSNAGVQIAQPRLMLGTNVLEIVDGVLRVNGQSR